MNDSAATLLWQVGLLGGVVLVCLALILSKKYADARFEGILNRISLLGPPLVVIGLVLNFVGPWWGLPPVIIGSLLSYFLFVKSTQ